MRRVRNILVSLLFCLFLAGPAMLYAAERLHVELPGWLTSEDAVYLAGGAEDKHALGQMRLGGFFNGDFQDAVDGEINGRIPLKAPALLANAALQRRFVALSDGLFGWEYYPTYYGSKYCFDSAANRLLPTAVARSDAFFDGVNRFADELASLADRHPECRFILYAVDLAHMSESNGTAGLCSHSTMMSDVMPILERASSRENVIVLTDSHESADSHLQAFYRTDHHWSFAGALEAYNTMAGHVPLAAIEGDASRVDDWAIKGSCYRSGLMDIEETPVDSTHSFSELAIELADGSTVSGDDHSKLRTQHRDVAEMYFYELYYGTNFGLSDQSLLIRGPGEGTALLATDSYGGAIKRLLAENYETLYTGWRLGNDRTDFRSIESSIDEHHPTDVYIVGTVTNMIPSE